MWPTPNASDGIGGKGPRKGMSMTGAMPDGSKVTVGLSAAVKMQAAMWPTPTAQPDGKTPDAHLAMKKRMGERDGSNANRTAITDLQVMAKACTLWPTPTASCTTGAGTQGRAGGLNLQTAALWSTPTATDGSRGNQPARPWDTGVPLSQQVAEPAAAFGTEPDTSPAQTEKPGALNPEFVFWLMGYPPEWLSCAPAETRSSRKSQRKS